MRCCGRERAAPYFTDNVLATYNPVDGAWKTASFAEDDPPEADSHAIGPQFSGDFLTLGGQVFTRGGDNDWQSTASTSQLPHVSGSTVANLGPSFITWQNADNRDNPNPDTLNSYAALLKNGDILTVADPFSEQKVQTVNGTAVLCGATAFATYESDISDFSKVGSFTLHRVLNQAVSDPTDCVVSRLEIVTGDQTLITTYDYQNAAKTAVFDPSGEVAQFPQVAEDRVDATGNSLGSTLYSYYNGLPPEDDDLAAADGPGISLADCFSLASGYIHTRTEYDDAGAVVTGKTNVWQGVALTPQGDGGFTPLSGLLVLRLQQSIDTSENLVLIDPTSGASRGSDGTRCFTISQSFVSQTGDLRSKTTTLFGGLDADQDNNDATQQTRKAELTYAWEVYEGMRHPEGDQAPMLHAEARFDLSLNGTLVQSAVRTFSSSWGQQSAWANAASWQWRGSGDGTFDFTSPDANIGDWLRTSQVVSRNAAGKIAVGSNTLGVPAVNFYDTSGLYKIAETINSDGSDASFTGFEHYEPAGIWSGGSIETGDAHTGNGCAQLASGKSLTAAGLTSAAGQSRYLLSGFVKSSDGAGFEFALGVGGAAKATTAGTATDDWQYVQVVADADIVGGAAIVGSVTNQGTGNLLVDDLWVTPVTADISARVFNSLMMPAAKVGRNGATARTFYDALLRPFARSGPDAQMIGIRGIGYATGSREALTNGYSTQLGLAAEDGGPFDEFSDGDGWQTRWSSDDASAWYVSDQTLTHKGQARHTVTLKQSADYGNYAVYVQACQGAASATPASGSFGIAIGSCLTAQWNGETGYWQLVDGDGALLDKVKPADAQPPLLPCNLLLIATQRSVHLFVNQQLTLAFTAAASQPDFQGSLNLFTDADGLGFAQVLVFLTPRAQLSFLDGCRRTVQHQTLADDAIIVGQSFYDDLGRPAIHTKPARYEETSWGYQPDFAVAPAPDQDWRMPACDLVSYYDGSDGRSDDAGYPYTRSRMENAATNRVLETGAPGAAHAIGSPTGRTSSIVYATNTAADLVGQSLPEQEYALALQTDADGLQKFALKDKIGNHYLSAALSASDASLRMSSLLLDSRDHPTCVTSPNGFDPPAGTTAADWQETIDYSPLGLVVAHTQADTGTTRFIYDDLGRVRFTLTADGADTTASSDVNPAAPGVAINYTTYDALGRPIETGYVSQSAWDAESLQSGANTPDWLPAAGVPRFTYHYDGDGNTPNTHGRIDCTKTRQSDGSVVTESYTYDLAGRVLTVTTAVPGLSPETVSYSYNHVGKVSSTTIPSPAEGTPLSVLHLYDARGLLSEIQADGKTIGSYTWNDSGQPLTEVLGDGLVNRSFTYTAAGRLAAVEGNVSGSQNLTAALQLYYETSPDELDSEITPWMPCYNGRLSAMRYQFGDGPQKTWTYGWDDLGRLIAAYGSDGETLSYAYDANGNLLQENETTFTLVPKTNRLQSVAGQSGEYAYTPSGRLLASPDWRFHYDFVSGLVTGMTSRTDSRTLSFLFGSTAQRLAKNWGDGTHTTSRRYLSGANRHSLVEQTTSEDGQQNERKLLHGPAALMAVQSADNTLEYVVKDHEQSTRLVVAEDGTETARFDYRPFGLDDDHPGGSNPDAHIYRYTGQEYDAETGLYNYRHRLYDPATRRFIAPDPMHQYFSPYLFVADSPLQHIDASGAWSCGATFGSIIGGAEILGGVALIGAGVATSEFGVGAALIVAGGLVTGAGIGGLGYSINTGIHGDYKWSQFGNAEAGGAIGGAEIAAGVAAIAFSGGSLSRLGGSTLIGAGFNALSYSAMAGNGFDWQEYGIQMGAGAAAGAVCGVFSVAGGWLEVGELAEEAEVPSSFEDLDSGAEEQAPKKSANSSQLARSTKKYLWDAGGGTVGGIVGQATQIGETRALGGQASWSELYSPRALAEDGITFGMGLLAAGAGDVYARKLEVGEYDPVKWQVKPKEPPGAMVYLAKHGDVGTWWKFAMPSFSSRPMMAETFVNGSYSFWGQVNSLIPENW